VASKTKPVQSGRRPCGGETGNGGQHERDVIMADAAYLVLTSDAKIVTGNFFVDDEVLTAHGVVDLSRYNPPGVADIDITPDLFVPSLLDLSWKRERGAS